MWNSWSGAEYFCGAHCLLNMMDYRNSMKMSCFEFGLCTCFGNNEDPSYGSSKMWVFFSEHWSLYSAFVYATSVTKCAVIGLFYLFEIVTFVREVHMLMVELHHSFCFLFNLRKNTLLTKGNSVYCCTIWFIRGSTFLLEIKVLWIMLFLQYRVWF